MSKLIIVSNRLPIAVNKVNEHWQVTMGSGGLVTALVPVLKNRGGLWIGWSGAHEETDVSHLIKPWSQDIGYDLKPIILTKEEVEKYYLGFSNEIVWPLFHDLLARCRFDPSYWSAYKSVNLKFAQTIAENTSDKDYIWVQDYHLMMVAEDLEEMNITRKIGFFLHIPFPPLDIFLKMPWRSQILNALIKYDLIGVQTSRDRRNFINCLRLLFNDVQVIGKGQVVTVKVAGRTLRVGNFPISIDYDDFSNGASTREVSDIAWYLHEKLPNVQIILGLDRLDYTKGIPNRLEAFRNALVRYPELRKNITLFQIVVPSREDIPEYHALKAEIERLVGEINGQFTQSGWVPIHYIHGSLNRQELLAHYLTSEIAIITPLKDGMNLVAKEYCAANINHSGVLILSEFAGATAQLQKGALLVNPYDIEGMADAIYQAFKMTSKERKARMKRIRSSIKKNNIYHWVDSFLEAAIAKNLDNFPSLPHYIPQFDIK